MIDKLTSLEVLKRKLDRYVKQKADFLAEISSEPLATTKNLYFFKEILIPFFTNAQLMDTIAANEDIRFEKKNGKVSNRLKFRFFLEGKELETVFSCFKEECDCSYYYPVLKFEKSEFPYSSICKCNRELQLKDLNFKNDSLENKDIDVEVALPGPLGEYAFYGFLENFIRNVAKHRKDEIGEQNLYIFVNLKEDDNKEFYKVQVWDNITDPDKSEEKKIDGNECKNLFQVINAFINSNIIEETGKLKRQAWGIAEMKINALLLSGSSDFQRIEDKGMLRINRIYRSQLPPFKNNADEEKNMEDEESLPVDALVYEFKIMKSKFSYILSKDGGFEKENLKKNGIRVFKSVEDLKKELTETESFSSPEFIFLDYDKFDNKKEKNELLHLKPYMPFRVLSTNKSLERYFPGSCVDDPKREQTVKKLLDGLKNNTDSESLEPWKQYVWNLWIQRIIKMTQSEETDSKSEEETSKISDKTEDKSSKKLCLHIYLDQNENENPTKDWSDFATNFNEKEFCTRVKVWEKTDDSKLVSNQREDCKDCDIHVGYDRHSQLAKDYSFDSTAAFDKHSSDFIHLFTSKIHPTIPFRFAEALLLRVGVADERITQVGDEEIDIKKDRHNLWEWGRICNLNIISHLNETPLHKSKKNGFFAPEEPDFRKNNLSLDDFYLKSIHTDENYSSITNLDMLLIHQGLIDNLDLSDDSKKELLIKLQKVIPFLIVESGRGIPPFLSKNKDIKFLPYSLIEQYIPRRISKYSLIRACMPLSRRNAD